MADKNSLDVSRIWHDSREFADKVWNPETARGLVSFVVGATPFNPADSTKYGIGVLFGMDPISGYDSYASIVLPCDLQITRVFINWYAMGNAGSNESITAYLVKYVGLGGYVTPISSVADTEARKLFSNTDLNLVLKAGDLVGITIACPAWTTNPTDVLIGGHIFGWAA